MRLHLLATALLFAFTLNAAADTEVKGGLTSGSSATADSKPFWANRSLGHQLCVKFENGQRVVVKDVSQCPPLAQYDAPQKTAEKEPCTIHIHDGKTGYLCPSSTVVYPDAGLCSDLCYKGLSGI